jgi:hypothetical protein
MKQIFKNLDIRFNQIININLIKKKGCEKINIVQINIKKGFEHEKIVYLII